MGRAPCCDKANVKKGPWSPEEDAKLKDFIDKFGTGGNWIALPQKAGLKRCGKSCRLRWLNYLRPNIKHGEFSDEEDRVICALYATIGSRWSIIAAQLPGRTDNDIKNYWNTKLKKKLLGSSSSLIQPGGFHQGKFSLPFSGSSTTSLLQSPQNLSTLHHLYASIYGTPISNAKSMPISAPQNFIYGNSNSNSFPFISSQEGGMLEVPYFKDNMLIFGGSDQQASCSSSDGSCSQISYGNKDHHEHHHHVIKQEDIGCLNHPHQGFIPEDQNHQNKFMLHQRHGKNVLNGLSSSSNHVQVDPISSFLDLEQKPNGPAAPAVEIENSSQLQLQYDLEEVKQLITSGGGDINSFLLNDENKSADYDHHQREVYYY